MMFQILYDQIQMSPRTFLIGIFWRWNLLPRWISLNCTSMLLYGKSQILWDCHLRWRSKSGFHHHHRPILPFPLLVPPWCSSLLLRPFCF